MKEKEVGSLSNAEFTRLKNVIINQRDSLILQVLYETGCTVNELVNIEFKHLNYSKKTIKFPSQNTKSHDPKLSYVSKNLVDQIKKELKGKVNPKEKFLFSTRQSSKMTTKRIRQLIQKYSTKAKIGKINPQIIRYTHIAHALDRGIPLKVVQKQVGIKRLRMAQIYEKLAPKVDMNVYHKFLK